MALVSEWGSTIKSPWACTVASQYPSWYDLWCCYDGKQQTNKPKIWVFAILWDKCIKIDHYNLLLGSVRSTDLAILIGLIVNRIKTHQDSYTRKDLEHLYACALHSHSRLLQSTYYISRVHLAVDSLHYIFSYKSSHLHIDSSCTGPPVLHTELVYFRVSLVTSSRLTA